MRIKRVLFVFAVMALCGICLSIMNVRYDRLSRYPYQEKQARMLINENLNDEEIEYIIEYSIAPSAFVKYIEADNFSIYHIEDYAYLDEWFSYLYGPKEIVTMIEETRSVMAGSDLAELMRFYRYDEVKFWLNHGDSYYQGAQLLSNPTALDLVLDDEHTISIHEPFGLVQTTQVPVLSVDEQGNKLEVKIDPRVLQPLESLCKAAKEEVSNRACGGLIITSGYISYSEQETIFKQAKQQYGSSAILYADYPGHSEHQLATALDFAVTGKKEEDFSSTKQAQWLAENAWRFGFVQTYTESNVEQTNKLARPTHYRFIGLAQAAERAGQQPIENKEAQ